MKRRLRLDGLWFVAALAAGLLNAASGAAVATGHTSDPLRRNIRDDSPMTARGFESDRSFTLVEILEETCS